MHPKQHLRPAGWPRLETLSGAGEGEGEAEQEQGRWGEGGWEVEKGEGT